LIFCLEAEIIKYKVLLLTWWADSRSRGFGTKNALLPNDVINTFDFSLLLLEFEFQEIVFMAIPYLGKTHLEKTHSAAWLSDFILHKFSERNS